MSGLGFGGLSISESESARNFVDENVYEKFSAKQINFLVVGWICLRRVRKFTFLRFGRKTTKFGPKTTKSVKMTQNDQNASSTKKRKNYRVPFNGNNGALLNPNLDSIARQIAKNETNAKNANKQT